MASTSVALWPAPSRLPAYPRGRGRGRRGRTAELVAQIRETAGRPRRFPGSSALDPLADILVHGQDIAQPLGRPHPMPLERVMAVLPHLWRSPFYGRSGKRFPGLRFVASDTDWSAGDGPREVSGPAGALLFLLTGRPAALADLRGDGLAEVEAALT